VITKEWQCSGHGYFEAAAADGEVPKCPHGCAKRFVKRVFLTAPSIRSARTTNSDKTIRNLAQDFRMSDVKNDKAGGSVMDAMRKGNPQKPSWGQIPRNAKNLKDVGFGGGTGGAMSDGLAHTKTVVGNLPGPRPVFQGRDPGGYGEPKPV
jgi:hypothetical protein